MILYAPILEGLLGLLGFVAFQLGSSLLYSITTGFTGFYRALVRFQASIYIYMSILQGLLVLGFVAFQLGSSLLYSITTGFTWFFRTLVRFQASIYMPPYYRVYWVYWVLSYLS